MGHAFEVPPSLEGVFSVVFISEDPPAHAEDHWPVPRDQGREGGLVALGHKPLQQLAFRQAGCRALIKETVQLLQHGARMMAHVDRPSRVTACRHSSVCLVTGAPISLFTFSIGRQAAETGLCC
jgi:hypothetical protein